MTRSGIALLTLAMSAACDQQAAEADKQCSYALEDAERALKEADMAKASAEATKAQGVCAGDKKGRADDVAKRVEARKAELAKLRKEQDEEEKKKKAEKKGPVPVLGKHSKEAGATGFCKQYVDCVCGIADWVHHTTGKDSQRQLCTDAKKVLGGPKAQDGCKTVLNDFTSNPSWEDPYKAMGIDIPEACP